MTGRRPPLFAGYDAGQKAEIAADHPLDGAAWAKMSLVRAKVTLPNGYCGAPVQTDCEYANPCLD